MLQAPAPLPACRGGPGRPRRRAARLFPGRRRRASKRPSAICTEAASQGSGEAILRLIPIVEARGQTEDDLLAQYHQAIEERGDADALIFAASHATDEAMKHDYLYRAASVIDCTFENTNKLAGAFIATADDAETDHWLQVSLMLAGEDGWRHTAIADRYVAMGGEQNAQTGIELYEEGRGASATTPPWAGWSRSTPIPTARTTPRSRPWPCSSA